MKYLIIIAVTVFYLLIPGVGAFLVRSQWRRFRRGLSGAAQFPILSYKHLHGLPKLPENRNFRMYGSLEAIQGNDRIWIRGLGISVGIDLTGVPIYILPQGGSLSFTELPNVTPRIYRWGELAALPEGTRIFVSGAIKTISNLPVFVNTPDTSLIVIIYDCPNEELFPRAIWTGRQRNEYWNALTAPAIGAGFVSLLVLALITNDRGTALLGIVLAIIPVVIFLPPGNIGLFLYRRFWRIARRLRSERDAVRLPLVYTFIPKWPQTDVAELPGGGRYYHVRIRREGKIRRESGITFDEREVAQGYHLFVRGKSAQYDPLPVHLISLDEPQSKAKYLENKAVRFELMSVACFLTGMGGNTFLAAVLLGNYFL